MLLRARDKVLSVTPRSVNNYLGDVEKDLREKRKEKIREMYLACYSNEEIGEEVGLSDEAVRKEVSQHLETFPNVVKVAAQFQDEDFQTPIYNIWTFAKKTNEVSHFGNTEITRPKPFKAHKVLCPARRIEAVETAHKAKARASQSRSARRLQSPLCIKCPSCYLRP
jgi:predicted DNA-binding protein YlxM (UPF0122 family)